MKGENKDSADKMLNTLDGKLGGGRARDENFYRVCVLNILELFSAIYRILKFINKEIFFASHMQLGKRFNVIAKQVNFIPVLKVDNRNILTGQFVNDMV